MDELDQLLTAKQDVVYNFFNWPTLRDSQLFVVAIANRMDLPQHLAAKVKSRLGRSRFASRRTVALLTLCDFAIRSAKSAVPTLRQTGFGRDCSVTSDSPS
jgi:hypothetical protein